MRILVSLAAVGLVASSILLGLASAGPSMSCDPYSLMYARDRLTNATVMTVGRVGQIRSKLGQCHCWRTSAWRQGRKELNTHNTFDYAVARCYNYIDGALLACYEGDYGEYRRNIRRVESTYRTAIKKGIASYHRLMLYPLEELPNDPTEAQILIDQRNDTRADFASRINEMIDAYANLPTNPRRIPGYIGITK